MPRRRVTKKRKEDERNDSSKEEVEILSPSNADIDVYTSLEDDRPRKRQGSSSEKGETGLRSFAIRVRKKVEEKQITTYSEVADELVKEVLDPSLSDPRDRIYNEKNVRRRVYDALNVLMAIGMIEKRKKDIYWKGMSLDNPHLIRELEEKRKEKTKEIQQKRQRLEELELQKKAVETMLYRNASMTGGQAYPDCNIHLPFIIVSTSSETQIDVEMEENAEEVLFTFNRPFEIYDDQVILQGVFRNTLYSNTTSRGTEQTINGSPGEEQCEFILPSHSHEDMQMKKSEGNYVDSNMFSNHLVYLTDDA
eukprot:jgi/Galph1/6011/GphlegSOOS_G4673.1